jgi:4-amino-4-deoxy-L-arabinose transferase-like glycosyltransferase
MKYSLRLTNQLTLVLTLIAFALRLAYALNSHPFIDEFTTVLAAQTILERGWPILPSGLFYEHGLTFSYLDAPFVALAGPQFSFAIARLPSIFIGSALVPLLYRVGRRWFSPGAGLVAATLLAASPEGMVWGGRARMYALAQLLILMLAVLAYEGSLGPGKARLRWLAWLTLLAALLTQLGALLFVPPLLVSIFTVRWLTADEVHLAKGKLSAVIRMLSPWEWLGLAGIVGTGILVKRLGQPLGATALGSEKAPNLFLALWETIAYQAGPALDYENTIRFLARQFGVPHHLWLAILAGLGLLILLAILIGDKSPHRRTLPLIFLWLVFGLVVLEMVTLLRPFRRNPRYLVMGLPLFYLIVGGSLLQIQDLLSKILTKIPKRDKLKNSAVAGYSIFVLLFVMLQARGLWTDLTIAYRTPEPAYDKAFQFVAKQGQPTDVVLSMNPSAAALYLDQTNYFAMQRDADQFLLNQETEPVDRWLGDPWIGTIADLNRVLNQHPQTWFVIDTIRLPVYYGGDWLAFLKTQMELVWAEDEALVYRTRNNQLPLPVAPSSHLQANLANQIRLLGYDARLQPPTAGAEGTYHLTLFWSSTASIPADYTVFIHVRDINGTIVAQCDSQPLGGDYPTSRWQPNETIIDPHQVPLPAGLRPGEYQIWVGMYQLETLERLPLVADTSGENAILLGSMIIQEAKKSHTSNARNDLLNVDSVTPENPIIPNPEHLSKLTLLSKISGHCK